jgi:hypothetical protein
MGKKKRQHATWADAELAYKDEARQRGLLEMALREMVIGKVHWIQGDLIMARRRIGILQLDRAHGGIIILQEHGNVSARYFDEWVAAVEGTPEPAVKHLNKIVNRDWRDQQTLARAAKKHREEFLARKALSPALINNVRAY